MQVKIKLSAKEIREAIHSWIQREIGIAIYPDDIRIQVKSKQNYKSEWEEAAFRAHFESSKIQPEG